MNTESTSNVWIKRRFTSPFIRAHGSGGMRGLPRIHGWTDGRKDNGAPIPFFEEPMAVFAFQKADIVWDFFPESDTFAYDTTGDPYNPPTMVRGSDIFYIAFDGEPIRKHVYPIFGAAFQWEEQPLGDDPEEND